MGEGNAIAQKLIAGWMSQTRGFIGWDEVERDIAKEIEPILTAEREKARREALEEAAQAADMTDLDETGDAIRALIDPPASNVSVAVSVADEKAG
jgi:hypothetical protein